MTKILKKSKTELFLLGKNRPYVEKKLIDSIIDVNQIFYINDILYKSKIGSTFNFIDLLKKPKHTQVKKLTGKDA